MCVLTHDTRTQAHCVGGHPKGMYFCGVTMRRRSHICVTHKRNHTKHINRCGPQCHTAGQCGPLRTPLCDGWHKSPPRGLLEEKHGRDSTAGRIPKTWAGGPGCPRLTTSAGQTPLKFRCRNTTETACGFGLTRTTGGQKCQCVPHRPRARAPSKVMTFSSIHSGHTMGDSLLCLFHDLPSIV